MKSKLFHLSLLVLSTFLVSAEQPNFVFIITDDQGYGDLGFTGNEEIQTPHLDKLAKESVWLTDYHAGPSCSPTRAMLMSGRWTNRTGVWHTFGSRVMMYEDEVTVTDHLKAAGYSNGLFGKWHLGDHYPYRPLDRGFDEVFRLVGGATGVTADYWDNDLYDDFYLHNGQYTQAAGYCTDVWFEQAGKFIAEKAEQKQSFFVKISTNAPHKPWVCPPGYAEQYKHLSKDQAAFYGMITNIDDNIGKLRELLEELTIADNTIVIFTTDNGTVNPQGCKAGMRAKKASAYEGGHRVPFAIHWPAGGMDQHRTVDELTHAVDVLPTILELAGVSALESKPIDGQSMVELFKQSEGYQHDWKQRIVISDSQRVLPKPIKWRGACVMQGKWRMIMGKELYHVGEDPGQNNNVAGLHPEKFEQLKQWYEKWWAELSPTFSRTSEIYVGGQHTQEVKMTCLQWINHPVLWNQGLIRKGPTGGAKKAKTTGIFSGHWLVNVEADGDYEFEVSRWPKESNLAITEGVEKLAARPGCLPSYSAVTGNALPIVSATLRINGVDLATKPVGKSDKTVRFTTNLKKGTHKFSPYFAQRKKGKKSQDLSLGCYYLYVKKL